MARVLPGSPAPLGMTLREGGANIAVFSQYATAIELCLFDHTGTVETARLALPERTGAVFHGFVEGIVAGTRYGLRAHGPWAPHEGHRFNPVKLLVDPYARALDRPFALHASQAGTLRDGTRDETDSAPHMPKGVLLPPFAEWLRRYEQPRAGRTRAPRRPQVPWASSVIYEMHLRGFTKQHPQVPVELRGTS
jgi:pullulanase/glycogen debranching enzyme